jgi:UDP-N-acetyl-D-glucosamine dehydrogenase
MKLEEKIKNRTARIGVIGLGYVGLPLAVEFARAGFSVTGIDIDRKRINAINSRHSYVLDVTDEDLKEVVKKNGLKATLDFSILKELDTVTICVPTPLRKTREPDISFVVKASKKIADFLHKNQLIVLESTTYPGTTDELILPILQKRGLKVGKNFFLAFSPERIDPGNKVYQTRNIPKVIGGITHACTGFAKLLYEQIIDEVIPVSSTRVAEMVKLLENTFRSVNIGLVNELALMCNRLGIDVWEVIDVAQTKPFGFMPFYPGPGLGGHCIPCDPFYLSWKARSHNFTARFIELAGEINSAMPGYVVTRIMNALNRKKKSLSGAKIVILGVTYKKNISDTRESPAIEIIHLLKDKGAEISYVDPYVPEFVTDIFKLRAKKLTRNLLKSSDAVVIITEHEAFDYEFVVKNSPLIIDTRNATKGIPHRHNHNVVKL